MRYPPHLIDQLKARINILDEVRKTCPNLKKKGRYWWANCPFHNEKSPSFHVREDQGSYYCFGCGAAGDVITFVQEHQGGTFTEVVQRLAKQVGFQLPEPEEHNPAATAQRQNGLKALERATIFFQRSLGGAALTYLKNRHLTESTIAEFQLGYAPEGWSNLKDAMLTEGFTPETLKLAGLTTESERGQKDQKNRDYDRFRHRIIFPIHNTKAEVVGFGGRVLDKSEPKYLNSPETPFFNKSYQLYNLHRAKPHLKASGLLVLVEGYMDVIALYQAGFKTAVAPLGTAVTEEQLGLLWQNNPAPIICLDGDSAGRTAALRAAKRALPVLEPGRTLQFVFLPQGEDPDSLVHKDGLATFRNLLGQTSPLEHVLWQSLTATATLSTADGRASLESEIGQLVATIRHATVRRHYSQLLRDNLYQATRGQKFGGAGGGNKPKPLTPNIQAGIDYRPALQASPVLSKLLAIVCQWPEILPQIDESLATLQFPPGPLNELHQHILRAYTQLNLPPEELQQNLLNGLHSSTVTSLLASTGTTINNPDNPPPLTQFTQQFQQWQQQREHKHQHTQIIKQADWFNPENWQTFKQLKES